MRFHVAPEENRFFRRNGYVIFDSLFTEKQLSSFPDKSEGYNLFAQDEAIKRFTQNRALAEIAAQLADKKALRLGFDLLFSSSSKLHLAETSLIAISSLEPLWMGALINLSQEENSLPEYLPATPGSVLFISPEKELDFSPLFSQKNQKFLLITYVDEKTLYKLNERDPHTHFLKKWHYVFGDRLKDETHPILFRN